MIKKRFLTTSLCLTLTVSLLAGCSGSGETSAVTSSASGEGSYTIGITQYAEHGSLDNCREGFLEGLAEAGIEEGVNLNIQFQNAQADSGAATQIASQFVSEKVDLICAIATPSAQSCVNAALDTDIPVVYTAVSDPVAA